MKTLMHDHGNELLKGALGVCSTMLGVLTSVQENVEYFMRCASLGIGMTVGLLTAISIVRGWRKKP